MIMQGTTPRTLSWGGLLALLGAGAFLLPVMPTWAQQPPPVAPEPIRVRFAAEDDYKKVEVTLREVEKLTAEIAAKKKEIIDLEVKLKAIQGGKAAAGGKEARRHPVEDDRRQARRGQAGGEAEDHL